MRRVREPAVSGAFYPASTALLAAEVSALLAAAAPRARAAAQRGEAPRPKAIVSPHAGYVYSGAAAARAWVTLGRPGPPLDRVILLGPSHRHAFRGVALPDAGAFRTPLGLVPVDEEGVAAARGAGARVEPRAHDREHALEVQLPFLARVAPEARIVPLVVGEAAPAEVGALLAALWGGPETAVVVSSDLSHFHPYEEARRLDEATARRIEARDPSITPEQACGARPLGGLLWLARERRLRVERLALLSSGDTAGDREEVVGYGAFALYE